MSQKIFNIEGGSGNLVDNMVIGDVKGGLYGVMGPNGHAIIILHFT